MKPRCIECRPYDYSVNGVVDLVDLMVFTERWLEVSLPNQIQITGDLVPVFVKDKVLTKTTDENGQPRWIYQPAGAEDPIIDVYYEDPNYYIYYVDVELRYAWAQSGTEYLGDGYQPVTAEGFSEATGTATITEYTGVTMAHFIYYGTHTGDDKAYRIARLKDELVWDKTANDYVGGLVANTGTFANSNIVLTYTEGLCGYPVTLPSNLPDGEYDLIFLNTEASSATAADREDGMGAKWHHNNLYAPIEKLVDRVG
jgi:hypothetical protein